MSSKATCEVSVDTVKAHEELKALRMQSEITAKSVMRDIRRGWMAMNLFLDIFHMTLPANIRLMASGAMMAGEMFAELAVAETISVVFALKAAVTFTAASMMFYRGLMLEQEANKVEQSINSSMHFIDVMMR